MTKTGTSSCVKGLFLSTGDYRIAIDGEAYASGLNYAFFKRYLSVINDLVVVGRYQYVSDISIDENRRVSGRGVSFKGLVVNRNRLSILFNHRQIKRELEGLLRQVDVAIARVPSEIALIAIPIAHKMGVPVLFEVVGCPYDALMNHGSFLGKIYAPFAAARLRKIIASASHVIYVSQKFLQNRYPTRGKSIGCSDVVIPERSPKVLEQRLSRISRWSYGNASIRLGLMGSLGVNYKGHEVAIRALPLLLDRGLDIQLNFAGGGDPERWRALAEHLGVAERVIFRGLLSRPEIEVWLTDTDIYLQPSKQEGLPRSIIEAMALGCPVVGSYAGGIPELVDEAFLVNADDAKDLAERIILCIQNTELAAAQARRNFDLANRYQFEPLQARRETFMRQWLQETYYTVDDHQRE